MLELKNLTRSEGIKLYKHLREDLKKLTQTIEDRHHGAMERISIKDLIRRKKDLLQKTKAQLAYLKLQHNL